MKRQRNRLLAQVGTLHALSPLSAMTRGFSLTFRSDGQLLRRADEVALGEIISVTLAPRAIEHLEDADVLEAKVVSRHSGT
jgi:exonuclease VII large subunit